LYFYYHKSKIIIGISKLIKILKKITISFVLVVVLLSLILSIPFIQTYLGKIVTSKINEDYHTHITINKIDLSFLGDIQLKEIQILDHHKDSLIYVQNLNTSIFSYKQILNNKLQFKKVNLRGVKVLMKTYKGENDDNLSIFINKFDDGKPSKPTNRFLLTADEISLNNAQFSLIDANIQNEPIVKYHNIGSDLLKFKIYGPNVYATIKNLHFIDKNKIKINKLSTQFTYTKKNMLFNNLNISTKTSNIKGEIIFNYKRKDLADFNNKVKIEANILRGNISLVDLHKFYGEFGENDNIHFSTVIKGTLNNFTLHHLNLTTDKRTKIQGDFNFKNTFTKNDDYYINSKIKYLSSNYDFLKQLLPNILGNSLPSSLRMLGLFSVTGNIITTNNFINADVRIKSKLGTSISNLNLKNIQDIDNAFYKGDVEFIDVDLGKIIGNKLVGKLSMKAKVNGKGFTKKDLNTTVYGIISKHQYKGYTYHNISVNGVFKNQLFDGELKANDKNIKLTFKGLADFSSSVNKFNFTTHVDFANFNKLNLFKRDSIAILKGDIDINLRGNSVNDLLGTINFKNASYTNQHDHYFFKAFNVKSSLLDKDDRKITFNSTDIINGEIEGFFKFEELGKLARNSIGSIFVNYKPLPLNKNPLYNTILSIKKIQSNNYQLKDINLVNVTLKDTLFLRTDFYGGDSLQDKYKLSFYGTINKDNKYVIGVKKSLIKFKKSTWLLNPDSNKKNKVVFDNLMQKFNLQTIKLASGNQLIELNGSIDKDDNENVYLKMRDVSLNQITPKIDSLDLKGTINGDFNFKKLRGNFLPFANFTINNFKINNIYQGDLYFRALGENSYKNYNVDVLLQDKDKKNLQAFGTIYFKPKKPIIDINISLDNFKLNSFSPLGEDVLSHIRGLAFGNVTVTGLLKNPNIDGTIYLENAGLAFPYLNVDYDFEGTPIVHLSKQTFDFMPLTLVDNIHSTKGILSGTISHHNFKQWFLDLKLDTKNLLVLNTKEDESSLYYGTGYVAGEAIIKGPTDNLVIDANVATLKGTEFIIPLSDVRTIDKSNLIHFVTKDEEENKKKATKDIFINSLKGLTLNFNLDVTKDAVAQIVIDKATGSVLRGSGDGNLFIDINTNGKFNMYGDFKVDHGIYQFKNIINKTFDVKKGGTITWNGNPYNADLNIEAIYKTRANPAVLLENVAGNRKVDVDLITKITGKLYESNLGFDVQIPNSSSIVNSELQFKLNDNDKKMTQFFSLLTTGTFIDQNSINFDSNAAIAGTISERISSVISDIFKGDNDKFRIGVNYDFGNTNRLNNLKTDDQLEISLSSKISRKFTINGKVGVPVGARTQSNVVGEVEIVSPLNKEGTLEARVFNRQNQIQFAVANEEGYTQGVGISYRVDFENLKELLEKVRLKKIKKIKQKPIIVVSKQHELLNFVNKQKDSIPKKID